MVREVSYMPDEGVDEEQAQGAQRREEKAEGAETVAKKPPADTGKRAAAPERAVATRARDGQNGAVGAPAGHAVVIAQPAPVGATLHRDSGRCNSVGRLPFYKVWADLLQNQATFFAKTCSGDRPLRWNDARPAHPTRLRLG